MRANYPKQRCPALWEPIAGVSLQLLVMEDVIFSDLTRGSRYDRWCKVTKQFYLSRLLKYYLVTST